MADVRLSTEQVDHYVRALRNVAAMLAEAELPPVAADRLADELAALALEAVDREQRARLLPRHTSPTRYTTDLPSI